MIRIDAELVRKAKEYGLNISKVSENALKEMIRRLESPIAPKEPIDCPDDSQNNGLVARGRFELPSAGPKPTMLVHYTRRSLTVASAPPPGLATFPFFRAVL